MNYIDDKLLESYSLVPPLREVDSPAFTAHRILKLDGSPFYFRSSLVKDRSFSP
jgi:hypothetical protein